MKNYAIIILTLLLCGQLHSMVPSAGALRSKPVQVVRPARGYHTSPACPNDQSQAPSSFKEATSVAKRWWYGPSEQERKKIEEERLQKQQEEMRKYVAARKAQIEIEKKEKQEIHEFFEKIRLYRRTGDPTIFSDIIIDTKEYDLKSKPGIATLFDSLRQKMFQIASLQEKFKRLQEKYSSYSTESEEIREIRQFLYRRDQDLKHTWNDTVKVYEELTYYLEKE